MEIHTIVLYVCTFHNIQAVQSHIEILIISVVNEKGNPLMSHIMRKNA